MATKKSIVEIQAVSLEKAKEIFRNRKAASPADLLAAQYTADKYKASLQSMSEVLNDTLLEKNLPDVEAIYGPNPMIVLVDKNPKTGATTKTNVLFKEKMVTESTVDKKAIMGLGGLVPPKYIVEKKDLDKTAVLNDAMAGTLDPALMAHVSVHTDLKFIVERRSGGTTPAPAAAGSTTGSTTAPADDEAI